MVVGNDPTDMTSNTLCTHWLYSGTIDNRYRCDKTSAQAVAVVDWEVRTADTCTDFIVNYSALRVYTQYH